MNETSPVVAVDVPLTPTRSDELVARTGFHPVVLPSFSALVARAASLAFRSCRDLTVLVSVLTRTLSRVWVIPSTCISCEMIEVVSRPLTSPLTLAVAMGHSCRLDRGLWGVGSDAVPSAGPVLPNPADGRPRRHTSTYVVEIASG